LKGEVKNNTPTITLKKQIAKRKHKGTNDRHKIIRNRYWPVGALREQCCSTIAG